MLVIYLTKGVIVLNRFLRSSVDCLIITERCASCFSRQSGNDPKPKRRVLPRSGAVVCAREPRLVLGAASLGRCYGPDAEPDPRRARDPGGAAQPDPSILQLACAPLRRAFYDHDEMPTTRYLPSRRCIFYLPYDICCLLESPPIRRQ